MHLQIIGIKKDVILHYKHYLFFYSYGGLTFGEQIEDDYYNRSHALIWFNNKGIL